MHSPSVTAGLKWPPEMCPTAYAMVSTVRPKAIATPRKPTPSPVSVSPLTNIAANTAVPQPPNTSQKVPRNSAPKALDSRAFIVRSSWARR